MNEVMDLLRVVFQTRNERAFPVSGTGRAGLEAAMVSFLEPGDRVVIGECGRFGLLMIEIAERCGADVVPVRAEWGQVIEPGAIARALAGGRTRMVAMIHGETSTGVLQPLAEIGQVTRSHDALFMADAVVTLGGSEVATDLWGVDVMVAGTQKCLSCPSGLAPITYNARAEAVLEKRASRIRSNYLDLLQLQRYWSPARYNHHTAPTSMVFGLREALRAIVEEGLDARFERHRLHGAALRAGLAAMGLSLFGAGPDEQRLPFITPVVVPAGVDELAVRRRLVEEFGIEIGAAFGQLQGKIWRIGTMGYSARRQNVLLCLVALESVLRAEGFDSSPSAGVEAARAFYAKAGVTDGKMGDNLGASGIGATT
jgi:(S)-ureidoglycine-glyoxylate aminotransferase